MKWTAPPTSSNNVESPMEERVARGIKMYELILCPAIKISMVFSVLHPLLKDMPHRPEVDMEPSELLEEFPVEWFQNHWR